MKYIIYGKKYYDGEYYNNEKCTPIKAWAKRFASIEEATAVAENLVYKQNKFYMCKIEEVDD